jgi:hypothetical protein
VLLERYDVLPESCSGKERRKGIPIVWLGHWAKPGASMGTIAELVAASSEFTKWFAFAGQMVADAGSRERHAKDTR